MTHYFTVPSTGRRVRIQPLPRDVLRRLETERDQFPKPPTYAVTYPGGETEQVPHDETTLETKADRVAWDAYISEVARLTDSWSVRYMKALIVFCLPTIEYDDDWQGNFDYLGIELPTDPRDLKVFYANNVLFPTVEDRTELANTIAMLNSFGRADLAAVQAEFRRLVPWYSFERIEPPGVGVEDGDPLFGGNGDGEVESVAEGLGSTDGV